MRGFINLSFIALLVINGILNCYAIERTEVAVIAAMHGAHKNHASYDYESLFTLVESYRPDYVGVEIRPEDINADKDYLASYYPYEMAELSQRYKNNVFGFDWLGDEIKGKPIPNGYFKNLSVLSLTNALYADDAMLEKRPKQLEALEKLQETLIDKATAASFNDGKYGQLCREIDTLETLWLKDTPYAEIQQFHQTRDNEIGQHLISYIEKNKGKRIVVVLGADHRTFAVENLVKHFADQVTILPVAHQMDKNF